MSGTSASRGSSAKLRAETPPMMMMKLCLVTIGATAAFNTLISEVMDEPFFAKLKQTGFTHLIVQYGVAGKDIFDAFLAKHPEGDPGLHGIGLGGFALTPDMHPYFMMAKNRRTRNQELGLVICHSGTGTILEALRHGLPMVVVPNPDLADNHQEDLARKVDQLKWGVMGKIGDVCAAIDKAEALQNEDNSFEEESVDTLRAWAKYN